MRLGAASPCVVTISRPSAGSIRYISSSHERTLVSLTCVRMETLNTRLKTPSRYGTGGFTAFWTVRTRADCVRTRPLAAD